MKPTVTLKQSELLNDPDEELCHELSLAWLGMELTGVQRGGISPARWLADARAIENLRGDQSAYDKKIEELSEACDYVGVMRLVKPIEEDAIEKGARHCGCTAAELTAYEPSAWKQGLTAAIMALKPDTGLVLCLAGREWKGKRRVVSGHTMAVLRHAGLFASFLDVNEGIYAGLFGEAFAASVTEEIRRGYEPQRDKIDDIFAYSFERLGAPGTASEAGPAPPA